VLHGVELRRGGRSSYWKSELNRVTIEILILALYDIRIAIETDFDGAC
jgi:hypothetical protein